MCKCGCNSCDSIPNLGVVLNESIVKRDILSENLRYHVQNKLPLTENTFRYGSQAFLNLWAEARSLYLREIIHVNEDDKEILTETDLGNYGVYEGVKVPLDLPMEDENPYEPILEDIQVYGKIYESVNIENSYKLDDIKSNKVGNEFIFTDKHGIKRKLMFLKGNSVKLLWFNPTSQEWTTDDIPRKYEDEKVMNTFGMILVKVILPKYGSFNFKALNAARYRLFRALIYNSLDTSKYEMDFNDETMEIEVASKESLNEGKKKNTLSNILNEIGDASLKPYEWTVKRSSSPSWDLGMEKPFIEVEYKFTTDKGVKYKAGFSEEEEHGFFHFAFYPEGGGIKDIINKGEVFKVMSTIVDIFKDFIEKEEWSEIYYSSVRQNYGDKRREKLYMAYLKKNLPDWIKIEDIGLGDMALKNQKQDLNEAKNDNKKLNKPTRDSSGGKAYKVYVKDPKTKKIKTVRFGSGGLKAKINNPKARQAFAARHDCKNKTDKTKASYWSCRLPRYAKLLGLKSSFSGFW